MLFARKSLFFKTFKPKRYFCSNNRDLPEYMPQTIEKKWQSIWSSESTPHNSSGEKPFYVLSMFPYPSGNLHMGHARVYTISDTVSRVYKMKGLNVLHPMGWDAFGLPAENAAIDRGIQPADWTKSNISNMKATLNRLGYQFNWDKELATCDPSYYKWTQWLFLEMFSKGLAYQKANYVNWDPVDKTVLANEQVDNEGRSWRSGAIVQKKLMNQWYLRITDYTQKLLQDLDTLTEWPQNVVKMQKEWIGEKSGCTVDFKLVPSGQVDTHVAFSSSRRQEQEKIITVFTTRPETIFGVSYVVLSPESPILNDIVLDEDKEQVNRYIEETLHMTDQQRKLSKDGVATGRYVYHPLTGEKIPLFLASYVLSSYATGSVMGVPAHDQRDFDFAKQMKLTHFKTVIQPPKEWKYDCAFTGKGKIINSEQFSGLDQSEGVEQISKLLKESNKGSITTAYSLRDWLVSRQRYWGCPIPLIHCPSCGVVPVPESDLPVILPTEGVSFSGEGSPLENLGNWANCKCPKCGGAAKRETDTLDTFVDSSWYYLRFPEAENTQKAFSPKIIDKWAPVNIYIGGIEHAILHLLYSRFIMNFLHQQGYVPTSEPFKMLKAQGMVHGKTLKDSVTGRFLNETQVEQKTIEGKEVTVCKTTGNLVEVTWEKMSKSKYNGVEPASAVEEFGADTVRLFLLFKVPMNLVLDWDIEQIQGQARWLKRIWLTTQSYIHYHSLKKQGKIIPFTSNQSKETETELAQLSTATQNTINIVTADLENMEFNTAIAHLMKLSNQIKALTFPDPLSAPLPLQMNQSHVLESQVIQEAILSLLCLIYPMGPHIVSELWQALREVISIPETPYWPNVASVQAVLSPTKPLVIQVNGKLIGTIPIDQEIQENDLEKLKAVVSESPFAGKVNQQKIVKIIVLQKNHMLVNFVISK